MLFGVQLQLSLIQTMYLHSGNTVLPQVPSTAPSVRSRTTVALVMQLYFDCGHSACCALVRILVKKFSNSTR